MDRSSPSKLHVLEEAFVEAVETIRQKRAQLARQWEDEYTTALQRDKQLHALGSAATAIAAYAALHVAAHRTRHARRLRAKPNARLLVALVLAMLVGLAKEAGDAHDLWPGLCPPCDASAADLRYDAYGVVLAAAMILCARCCNAARPVRTFTLVCLGYSPAVHPTGLELADDIEDGFVRQGEDG